MTAYSKYAPGNKGGGHNKKITQSAHILMQGRKAPAMCRRRHFRLRPRLGNLQRREGPTISPRKRESGNSKRCSKSSSKSTKEAIFTGLRFFCETRRRVNDNIGCYEKYRTYIRGGARDIKMAEASRRFAAGERATSSHRRKSMRRIHNRTMGCVQGRTPRIKCTGKTKVKLTILSKSFCDS